MVIRCVLTVLMVGLWLVAPVAEADDYTGWRREHPEWKLVFSDDFKGRKLDTKKWSRIEYEKGRAADWRRYQSKDEELVEVNGNSTVSLWGKYGDFTSQDDPEGENDTYACGGIFTTDTFCFQYGYVEVKAKFDCARGAWPAIWLMPTDGSRWPAKGEIDVMEHLNWENQVYQTIHYNDASGKRTSRTLAQGAAAFDSELDRKRFHTYGVKWTPEAVTFYMDGRQTGTFPAEPDNPNWPFNLEDNPFYLLLDMQLGGSWVGAIDREGLGDGVEMVIDYVRVYADPKSVIRGTKKPEVSTEKKPQVKKPQVKKSRAKKTRVKSDKTRSGVR